MSMKTPIRYALAFSAVLLFAGCAHHHTPPFSSRSDLTAGASFQAYDTAPEPLPALDENSSLKDLLTFAELNNAGLKAEFLRWKAALETIPEVRALPDPRFTYAWFIQRVETRVGPQRQRFVLSQTFPWFGKLRLKENSAFENARAAEQRVAAARLRLLNQVKDAWYEYYYINRSIAITRQHLNLLADIEQTARTGYAAGTAGYSDIIRAQVELGKVKERLDGLLDLQEPVIARLNASLNRPACAAVPVPQRLDPMPADISQEQLLAWLKDSSPELKAIDFQALAEKWSIALAGKNYYPDMSFGLEFIDTGPAANPATDDSGKDPVIGTVSINIPLWRSKYRAAEHQAQARYDALLQERKDRENRLGSDIKLAFFNFRDSERKIDLFNHTLIPKARQSLEVIIESYTAGKASFSDIIDTLRTILEFDLAYERALASREQHLSRLQMLVGREF